MDISHVKIVNLCIDPPDKKAGAITFVPSEEDPTAVVLTLFGGTAENPIVLGWGKVGIGELYKTAKRLQKHKQEVLDRVMT